jgi:hypothetical protein
MKNGFLKWCPDQELNLNPRFRKPNGFVLAQGRVDFQASSSPWVGARQHGYRSGSRGCSVEVLVILKRLCGTVSAGEWPRNPQSPH